MKKSELFTEVSKYRFNSVFYRLIILLLLLTIIPALFGASVIYRISITAIKEEVGNANGIFLESKMEKIDSLFEDIHALVSMLENDSSTKTILNQSYEKNAIYDDFLQMKKRITTALNTYSFIEDICIYFPYYDTIVSREIYPFDLYFGTIYRFQEYDLDFWTRYFADTSRYNLLKSNRVDIRSGSNTQDLVVLTYRIPFFLSQPKAFVVVLVKESMLSRELSLNGIENSDALIVNQTGDIVTSSNWDFNYTPDLHERIKTALAADEGELTENLEDGESFYSIRKSTVGDWVYITRVPLRYLESKVYEIRIIQSLLMASLILLGAVLSFILSKKAYQPIKGIIDVIQTGGHGDGKAAGDRGRDEIGFIINRIGRLHNNETLLKGDIEEKREQIHEYIVGKLAMGELEGITSQKLAEYHIRFEHRFFAVAVALAWEDLHAADWDGLRRKYSGRYPGESIHVAAVRNNEKVILMNLADDSNAGLIERMTCLQDIMTALTDNIALGYGNPYVGYAAIRNSYNEARMAVSCRTLLGGIQLIGYKGLRNTVWVNYAFVSEIEKLLKKVMTNPNADISPLIGKVAETAAQDRLTHEQFRLGICLLSNIVGDQVREESDSIRKIDGIFSYDDVRDYLEMYFRLIGELRQNDQKRTNRQLKEDIERFIEAHFDQDIYLELIADRMGYSVSYLSRFFKENFGELFTDYLNLYRIGKAKELLRSTERKISEISQQVGYNSPNTFVKTFKKYEKITPGTYRSLVS